MNEQTVYVVLEEGTRYGQQFSRVVGVYATKVDAESEVQRMRFAKNCSPTATIEQVIR